MDAEIALLHIYKKCVNLFGWNLKAMDETNFETLIDFLTLNDADPNERVINGKVYKRAQGVPEWL